MRTFLVIFLMVFATHSWAADFGLKFHTTNGIKIGVIELEGKIEKGDYEQYLNFAKLINSKNMLISALILNSSGGLVGEALKIGRHVRENGIMTLTKNEKDVKCYSSCALIWFAGIRRKSHSQFNPNSDPIWIEQIGVHRSYLKNAEKLSFGTMEKTLKKNHKLVQKYLNEMRVPNKIIQIFLNTSSTNLTLIETDDYTQDRLYEEYVIAQCGPEVPEVKWPEHWVCSDNEAIRGKDFKIFALDATTRALCKKYQDRMDSVGVLSPKEKTRKKCANTSMFTAQKELQFGQ
jgi:hypothetical protein